MSKQDLDRKGMDEVLSRVKVCHLGTVDSEGKPYIVPLGYRYVDGAIYIHVAERGEKTDNIQGNPDVCVEVTALDPTSALLRSEGWGDFSSVIIRGRAQKVTDEEEKIRVYGEAGWGVVYKIEPEKITGRAWFWKSKK